MASAPCSNDNSELWLRSTTNRIANNTMNRVGALMTAQYEDCFKRVQKALLASAQRRDETIDFGGMELEELLARLSSDEQTKIMAKYPLALLKQEEFLLTLDTCWRKARSTLRRQSNDVLHVAKYSDLANLLPEVISGCNPCGKGESSGYSSQQHAAGVQPGAVKCEEGVEGRVDVSARERLAVEDDDVNSLSSWMNDDEPESAAADGNGWEVGHAVKSGDVAPGFPSEYRWLSEVDSIAALQFARNCCSLEAERIRKKRSRVDGGEVAQPESSDRSLQRLRRLEAIVEASNSRITSCVEVTKVSLPSRAPKIDAPSQPSTAEWLQRNTAEQQAQSWALWNEMMDKTMLLSSAPESVEALADAALWEEEASSECAFLTGTASRPSLRFDVPTHIKDAVLCVPRRGDFVAHRVLMSFE